jgi:hypothetical protein
MKEWLRFEKIVKVCHSNKIVTFAKQAPVVSAVCNPAVFLRLSVKYNPAVSASGSLHYEAY